MASAQAPWTWAAHRSEYASWTRSQSTCDSTIPLPSVSAKIRAADASWPGWVRPHPGQLASAARIEGGARTAQGFEAEGGHHVGGQQEPLRVLQQQAGRAGHEVRAIEDAERILGLQLQRLDVQRAQRFRAA